MALKELGIGCVLPHLNGGIKKILSFKQKQTFHEPICFANC